MNNYIMKIKKLHLDAIIPEYATEGSVAFDLHSLDRYEIFPDYQKLIRTGLSVEIPIGFEMQIRQRSGLSIKYPNYIMNSPGTIDQDFVGEILIPIRNNSENKWYIRHGDRIAQAIISPIIKVKFIEVNDLSKTKRGKGGFGHTGI